MPDDAWAPPKKAEEIYERMGSHMFSAFSGSKSPTFTPAPVAPMLPETLEKNEDGTTVNTKEALAGKIVALYFSSSWCGACLRMTPILHTMHTSWLRWR